MMEKKRWLWKRKSSEKSPVETESSASEALKEFPNGTNHSPDITSKAGAATEDVNDKALCIAQPTKVSSKGNVNDCLLEEDNNHAMDTTNNIKEGDLDDGLKTLSEKLSAALVNVSAKEDLVKQHAKVAEEAIAGWEKAQNEVAILTKQLEVATLRNSALEDRGTHLDGALKECVRQLRQTRDQQEQNIHAAVTKKTHELESARQKLQSQLSELQVKLDASNARYPTPVDFDLNEKIEFLEKENMALQHELLTQSKEIEIRTIEMGLCTQAAETASKQHLESIKKVAKLEAECRRLKAMACRASSVNDHKSIMASSCCVHTIADSQSDNGERLIAAKIDDHKMSSLQLKMCEPNGSDSWACALISQLDQFKNQKSRQNPACTTDLMDDFLEMERLAALPDTKNENYRESIVANPCMDEENSLKAEFDILTQHMAELREKLRIVKSEKADLQMALMKSEDCIETSQLQQREAEKKLEELQRELNIAMKSKQKTENELASIKEAQNISAEVDSLQVEVEKERAFSAEIAMKCRKLEQELQIKTQEEKLRSTTNSCGEMKIKQEELAVAAGKLAECQKTIASLGNQLNSLATLEDFLVDAANVPGFSVSGSLVARAGGETRRQHSNDAFSLKRESNSLRMVNGSCGPSVNKNEESSVPSSTSDVMENIVSSERVEMALQNFSQELRVGYG